MRVLFVCASNINRSQIAEAVFNKISKRSRAYSAGMKVVPRHAGKLITKIQNNPTWLMKLEGYDLSGARMRKLSPAMLKSADKIVVIRSNGKLNGSVPSSMKNLPEVEWWDVKSIKGDISFEEYCRLERKRIRKIEALVKGLIEQTG